MSSMLDIYMHPECEEHRPEDANQANHDCPCHNQYMLLTVVGRVTCICNKQCKLCKYVSHLPLHYTKFCYLMQVQDTDYKTC